MTREYIKIMLPIMQAFAEGKTLQYRVNEVNNEWKDIDNPTFNDAPSEYRIKPKPKYRPFENKEECWNEMLVHQPFGWVTDKCKYFQIVCVRQGNIEFSPDEDNSGLYSCIMTFSDILERDFIFADGTPFGIKEE